MAEVCCVLRVMFVDFMLNFVCFAWRLNDGYKGSIGLVGLADILIVRGKTVQNNQSCPLLR